MAEQRRSLIEGLSETPKVPGVGSVDPSVERAFIRNAAPVPTQAEKKATSRRTSVTTRIREDLASALKRASLERQLKGIEPSAVQDILDEALEPWLKANGYLQ